MIYKRTIVNFLFVLGFPVYGFGVFVSATRSPSVGFIVSLLPSLAILAFYAVDMLYQRRFQIRINALYWIVLTFLISSSLSLYVAFAKGLPDISMLVVLTMSLLILLPFHSYIVVHLYNQEADKSAYKELLLIGLSLLLFLNVVGYYGLGITNETHQIEGRINFPFLAGFYEGASLLVIINLLLIFYFPQFKERPIFTFGLLLYFMANLAMIFMINSRLSIIIFLMVVFLIITNLLRNAKGIFVTSLFLIPILLGSGLLLFKILQLPVFSVILQRVDLIDVTTFNGRAFLWQDALDWLIFDHRGLLMGNGYRGHYFLNLISDVAALWNEKNEHNMHLHSTSLEILVNQGIIVFAMFMILCFKVYSYYKRQLMEKTEEGPILAIIIYLLFILQVDTFVYLNTLGALILALFFSKIVMKEEQREIDLSKES